MIEVNNIKSLVNLPREPEDGEIALCSNSNQKYRFSKDLNDWVPYKELTKYDYEASLAAQWSPYGDEEKEKVAKYINDIFEEDFYNSGTFILIGLKEFKYLTIFNFYKYTDYFTDSTFGTEVVECINNIGDLLSCNYNKSNQTIEMWVKIDGKPVQLTLMDYQEGVVKL